MTADPVIRLRFWGTRGSLPVSGEAFRRFGGATMSIEMRCGPVCLLFDAGSGVGPAGKALAAEGVTRLHLLFTHCHYDHILGFPFFAPLYNPAAEIDFWSGHLFGTTTTRQMIGDFMGPPFFPVGPDVCPARLRFHDFEPGAVLEPAPGLRLLTRRLNHPGGAVGYRVEWGGKVVCIVTDTEHEPGTLDPTVIELIRGADLFIYDASYLDSEMARYKGFGHSTWQQAVRLAEAAGVARAGMIHHAPWRTDAELAAIEAEARAILPGAFVTADGMTAEA
ncbi:MAG: MBL fold metallo-hydrolase [Paracoccaceae bacterium]